MSCEPPNTSAAREYKRPQPITCWIRSFVICSAATCQSSAEPSMQNGFVRVEASCDVSSASIRIDLATPRVAHVNRGCCLQMVPRGSNAHYFSIQASPAPTSPPEFFLHSYMHSIAPVGLADGEPGDRRRCRAKSIVNRPHRLIAYCSVLIFVAWSPHIPRALPRQKSCCATRH